MNKFTNNIFIFMLLFIYKISLDIVYIKFANKLFEYYGYILDFNCRKFIIGFLWLVFTYIILPKTSKKPSSIILQIQYITMILPLITLYGLMNKSGFFLAAVCLCFSMQCFLVNAIPNLQIVKIKNARVMLYGSLILMTIIVYVSMIAINGIPNLAALNLNNVYAVRDLAKYPAGLVGYLVSWQGKIVNPFIITTSYYNKRKKFVLLGIGLQLLLFLITAHKSYLFIPIGIISVINILKNNQFLKPALALSIGGVLGSYVIYYVWGYIMPGSFFIRRFLFVPAQLKYYYYDFFSQNQFLYFSQGIIGKILGIKNNYSMNIVHLIGEYYFGSTSTAANVGYFADAYANAGYIGMFIFSIIFLAVLVFINSLSKNLDKKFVIGISLFPIMSLNDTALLTTLLTGGLLILLIILFLYSNSKTQQF